MVFVFIELVERRAADGDETVAGFDGGFVFEIDLFDIQKPAAFLDLQTVGGLAVCDVVDYIHQSKDDKQNETGENGQSAFGCDSPEDAAPHSGVLD